MGRVKFVALLFGGRHMRPKSTDRFALVYGIIIIAGLVSTWLSWDAMMAQASVQQMVARFGTAPVYASAVVGVLIQLLLWYFIVQHASVVAKWIFVVLTVLAIASSLWGFAKVGIVLTPVALIGLALLVLQAVAIWLLFQPDANVWFDGEDEIVE